MPVSAKKANGMSFLPNRAGIEISSETKAACTVEKSGDGFRITTMKLVVRATVPGADAAAFQKIAEATKDGCPVSQVMKGNLKLEMDAALA